MTQASVREIILALALFFNPLGYNELFAGIMKLTSSYWITALILYTISGSLFLIYLILKNNR
jgi:hypothetical protein